MPPNDEFSDDPKPEKKGGGGAGANKSSMGLMAFGVAVMILTPLITFFVVRMSIPDNEGAGASHERSATAVPEKPIIMRFEPMVVNISGTRMTRILRVQVHLLLSEERLQPVLSEMTPVVTDRIMSTLSRRTLDELEGVDEREALKRDIATDVNALVRDRASGSVLDVVFSEFLIQ